MQLATNDQAGANEPGELNVTIRHENAPPGSRVSTSASDGINVAPPTIARAGIGTMEL